MVKKKYKSIIFILFLLIIYSIDSFASNFSENLLKEIYLSKDYKKNILILSDYERRGYRSSQIYLLLAYNYVQIGEKAISLIYLRKGLFYNKNDKDILNYIKFLAPNHFDDITNFPLFTKISPFIIVYVIFLSNSIILLFVIIKKKHFIKIFLLNSILLIFLLVLNFIYPYIDNTAFTIKQSNIYKYPTINSPIVTNVVSAMPLKIKLIGKDFNFVILTNGIEGWILKKDMKKVFLPEENKF